MYDAEQGRWRPRCSDYFNSPYALNGYIGAPRYSRLRTNRRQGNRGLSRGGHSATFEAFRGAIAFG